MKYLQQNISIIIFLYVAMFAGCATTNYTPYYSNPEIQTVSNENYDIAIMPVNLSHYGGWDAFQLKIKNKTNKDIELDWNRTLFIKNGETYGSFMFEGVVYKDRNNSKPADIIFPGSTLSRRIWPNNLVEFSGRWHHHGMGYGEFGVLLSLIVDGQEVREKMIVTIAHQVEDATVKVNTSTPISLFQLYEDYLGLTLNEGLRVFSVKQNAPAYGRISKGDIIIEINRQPVKSLSDYEFIIQKEVGKNVLFLISREGRMLFITVSNK